MLRNLGFILELGKHLFLWFWPFNRFLPYLFPSALSYPLPPYLLPSAVLCLAPTLVSFLPPPCIVPVCFLRRSLWDLSLKSQYLLFLVCRKFLCLENPSSSFTTTNVLSYPFPCLYGLPISPPVSCSSVSVFHFLSPLLSLPRYLYLKISCLAASFTFMKFWPSLLEQAGPCLAALPGRLS